MENMSNSELLYDVIDTLTDEEFKDLLDTLSITSTAEEVIAAKAGEGEPSGEGGEGKKVVDPVAERREALAKKLEEARQAKQEQARIAERREAIKKRIEEARNADKNKEEEVLRKKIMEKLNVSRKKKAIQERVIAIREGKK